MKSVNIDETEGDEFSRILEDTRENMIFMIISDNRVKGISASEIEEKIKGKKPALSRQSIDSHLSELLKKHRIYKVSRRYFPRASQLNEIRLYRQN